MPKSFAEEFQLISAFVPVDLQTGANNGDWINMANYERVWCVLFKGIGTAGDDPIFKLQQATAAAGTGAKDILFTVIHSKVGATAISAVGEFTKTTQTAATSFTDAVSAENEAMITVEVRADQLDNSNDFTHIQLSVADVGSNAQLGCAFYILSGPRYPQATAKSAID